jgi:hypothetical protein
MVANKLKNKKGQAAIEMALCLPFIVWLIYYTLNAYHMIHTSHVAQKFAAQNLYQRLENRAQFVVDQVAGNGRGQLVDKSFLAVEYEDPETNRPPKRRILLDPFRTEMVNRVGICREPDCR